MVAQQGADEPKRTTDEPKPIADGTPPPGAVAKMLLPIREVEPD